MIELQKTMLWLAMVKLSLVRLSESGRDLWNDYVSANPKGYPYHLWEWGDVLKRTYNLRGVYIAVKEDQRIVGVLPVFCVRGLFFADKIVSLPFCEYGGPLIAGYLDQPTAEHVLMVLVKNVRELADKLKIDYIEFRHPQTSFSSARALSSCGFGALRRYVTFRLDLTMGESRMWASFDGLTRRRARERLKRAMNIGTIVEEVDVDSLKRYYTLYLGTQKRHGSPPHSYAFFKNLYDCFNPKGLLRMFLAVSEGKPIAGITVFCFNGVLYCWNNVLDRKYASSHPTDFLLWHIIQWGTRNDFGVLDLGRTRPEDKGVYHFKRRWGGQKTGLEDQVLMLRSVEVADPLQARYVFFSRLWSLLPSALGQKAGPYVVSRIGL
jgi:CelD/BcsL family acetyltransferase involved in cellulose biosynthesis